MSQKPKNFRNRVPRPTKMIVHVHKRKAFDESVPVKHREAWTVHNRGRCIPATHVRMEVPSESEEKLDRDSNPKLFWTCYGYIRYDPGNKITIVSNYKDSNDQFQTDKN